MSRFSLDHLADYALLDGLHALVEHDHVTTAELLAHIGEVARRRLYSPMGHPSMQAYCVKVLHLSEDAASKRVQVARKGWLMLATPPPTASPALPPDPAAPPMARFPLRVQ